MSRTALKTHVWQHHTMEQGDSFEGPIHDGNSMECPELHKTHVFFSSTSTGGFCLIHYKILLKLHEMSTTLHKFNVWQPQPHG